MRLYIELSEFLGNPIRTGIQRIAGEICRYLPPGVATPVRFQSGRYVALSPALISAIGQYFSRSETADTEIRALAHKDDSEVRISPKDIFLVPEVFTNTERVAFFRKVPAEQWRQVRFIVYDLLPLTCPEYFHPDAVLELYAYYQLIRRAAECGFISEATRNDYYGRLKRTDARGGVVLPLGCDSLGSRATQPAFNRMLKFTVLGTVEPRKNHKLILEAFEPLLQQINGLTVTFIGNMGWVDGEFARKVETLGSNENSGFQFHSGLGDRDIRERVQEARATIYISSAEGYGLPPVESLWLGTPVIASRANPSLDGIRSGGVHYVEPLTAANLTKAILAFLDDDYANQKVEETIRLVLPTWKSFAEQVIRWCTDGDNCGA